MCLRRRGSAGIRWPYCPRRTVFPIIRCSRSHASSTSPRAPSCFLQKLATRVTSEFLLLAEKSRSPVIRTWEPPSFLASAGEFGEINSSLTVTFEEEAGLVPITIYCEQGAVVRCEVAAPESLSLGKTIAIQLVASAVSLSPEDILIHTHHPQVCSVGLPFVITELQDRTALERARINMSGFDALADMDIKPSMPSVCASERRF